MNIVQNPNKTTPKTPTANGGARKSLNDDFSKFKPLDSDHLKKFSTMRDPIEANSSLSAKSSKNKRDASAYDSDEDLDDEATVMVKAQDANEAENEAMMSPEDRRRQGELADGVQKIRVS